MNVQATVVSRFKEIEHDNHIYQPGEVYPAAGYEADPERVAFLSAVHPKYQRIYLAAVQGIDDSPAEYPKHVGGSTFELSNGEKVKGKEEALAAEKALKE